MVEILFWICLALLLITYLWYPVSSVLISQFRKKIVAPPLQNYPTVSLIVAAHNEESVIQQKLENLLKLDYPKEKLHIIVASDGSTDRTNEIVKSFQDKGIELLECPRVGKTEILNRAVQASSSEIVVFTDADPLLEKQSLKRIIAHFSNPKVGMVCGNSIYGKGEQFTGTEQESVYWNFENWLKFTESRAYRLLVGGIGDLFAARRELLDKIPPFLNHDFITQLMVASKGFWVLFEPTAFAFAQGSKHIRTEYKRKVRIVFQSAYSLFWKIEYLNFFRHPLMTYQLFVHKILRWSSFLFFFPLLPLSYFLKEHSSFYFLFFHAIALFWIIGIVGGFLSRLNLRLGVFGLPYYFILVTFAALHGLIKSFLVKPKGMWEIERQSDSTITNQ